MELLESYLKAVKRYLPRTQAVLAGVTLFFTTLAIRRLKRVG